MKNAREGENLGRDRELSSSEYVLITPESLLKDNRSPRAQARRDRFNDARRSQRLTLVYKCSDARGEAPFEESLFVSAIAAGGPIDVFEDLVTDRGVRRIVTLSHYDEDLVVPGESPGECGGRAEKLALTLNPEARSKGGASQYVDQYVSSSDVILQACIAARRIALLTEKPVFAAAQNHRDGSIKELAFFKNTSGVLTSTISTQYAEPVYDQSKYDPAKIYTGYEIPSLPEEAVSDEFSPFIEENERHMASIRENYPALRQMQKVQSQARLIVITTDVRPLEIRYPHLTSFPGIAFRVSVPRQKIDGGVHIEDAHKEDAIKQAHYALSHAIEHHRDRNSSFSLVNRVLIETGDIDKSADIAERLSEKDWMKEWLGLDGRRIFVAETRGGIVYQLEDFKKTR